LLTLATLAFFVPARGAAGATAPLLHRLTIPGVAADTAGALDGPTTVSPLVVARHISLRLTGGLTTYGEVYNGLDHAITGVSVHGVATAEDGTPLGDRTVTALTKVIPAHGVGLFAIPFFGPAGAKPNVVAEVASYSGPPAPLDPPLAITLAGPKPVEIVTYDPKTHQPIVTLSATDSYLDGTVTNTTDHAITSISVMAAFYDGSGNVALVANATKVVAPFPQAGQEGVLQPGQTGAFRVPVLNADYAGIAGVGPSVGFANFAAPP
jgi:hypothetical protein